MRTLKLLAALAAILIGGAALGGMAHALYCNTTCMGNSCTTVCW